MSARTCNFWGLKLSEICDLLNNVLSSFCGHFQNVFPLLYITFTSNSLHTYDFAWKCHIIITDKYPVSSQKFYFRYAFPDNFNFINVFFNLVVSKILSTVFRWVPRLLIWWCYTQDKLGSKSDYGKSIWILNLLYVTYHYGSNPTVVIVQWSWMNSSWVDSHHIHGTC